MCRMFALMRGENLDGSLGVRLALAFPPQQTFGPHAVALGIYGHQRKNSRTEFNPDDWYTFNVLFPEDLEKRVIGVFADNNVKLDSSNGQVRIKSLNSDFVNRAFRLTQPLDAETLDEVVAQINSLENGQGQRAFSQAYGPDVIVVKDTVSAQKFFAAHKGEHWEGDMGGYHLRYATKEALDDPQNAHWFPVAWMDKEGNYNHMIVMANGQLTNDRALRQFVDKYRATYLKGREHLFLQRVTNVDTNLQGLVLGIYLREQISKYGYDVGIDRAMSIAASLFDGPYTLVAMGRVNNERVLAAITSKKNNRPLYIGLPPGSDSVAISSSEDALIRAFPEGVNVEYLPDNSFEVWSKPDIRVFEPNYGKWVMQNGISLPERFVIKENSKDKRYTRWTQDGDTLRVGMGLLRIIGIANEAITSEQLRDYETERGFTKARKEEFIPIPEIEAYYDDISDRVQELFGVRPLRKQIMLAKEYGASADIAPLGCGIVNHLIDKLGRDQALKTLELHGVEASWNIGAGRASGEYYGEHFDFAGKSVVVYGSGGTYFANETDDIRYIVRQFMTEDGRKVEGNVGEHAGLSMGPNAALIVEGDAAQNAFANSRGLGYIMGKAGPRFGKALKKSGVAVVGETCGIDSFEWMNAGIGIVGWQVNQQDPYRFKAEGLATGNVGGIVYFGGGLEELGDMGDKVSIFRLNNDDRTLIGRVMQKLEIDEGELGKLDNYVKLLPRYINLQNPVRVAEEKNKAIPRIITIKLYGDELFEEYGKFDPDRQALSPERIFYDEERVVERHLKFTELEKALLDGKTNPGEEILNPQEKDLFRRRYVKNYSIGELATHFKASRDIVCAKLDELTLRINNAIRGAHGLTEKFGINDTMTLFDNYRMMNEGIILSRDKNDKPKVVYKLAVETTTVAA
ncbi:TPA: hypothetical protein HA246_03720 [Candidatus Woesearchaeota archaeon]|nr:hypothetical protein [Candidatus Woesearchaeota archaeon]